MVLHRYEETDPYDDARVRELEHELAALEGAEDAVALQCGMSAIETALVPLLKFGDHVVLFEDCYRRTRQLVVSVLGNFGVEHSLVEAGDLAGLEDALRPTTKIVLCESPTNPHLHSVDLVALAGIVRSRGGILSVVDASFASPVNMRPLALGADLVVHSATKYLNGHNDVLAGVAAGSSALIARLREYRGIRGNGLHWHAASLVSSGLTTLRLRVAQQNATGLALAQALEDHPKVERVYYPLLESHPSYAIAARQMTGGGGIVSFVVRGGRDAGKEVLDGCRMAVIAPSFGGVQTLIEQPPIMSYYDLEPEQLAAIGIEDGLIRVAVGIEETDDVVQDIVDALDAA